MLSPCTASFQALSVNAFGDVSEMNGRETPKQSGRRMREHFSGKLVFQTLRSSASYGFVTLVESAKIVDRLLKPLNVPGQLAYRPLKIDFGVFSECFGEFVSLKTHCLLLLHANHVMCKRVYTKYQRIFWKLDKTSARCKYE